VKRKPPSCYADPNTWQRAKPISSRMRLIRLRLSVYQGNLPLIKVSFPYVRRYFTHATTFGLNSQQEQPTSLPEDVVITAFIQHLHERLEVARYGCLQGRNAEFHR
jgi:hypothetical protein